jgi:hypothetical protein
MDIRTKASQLHLLTLPCFNSQRVRIYPLICRDIRRLGRICQDIEHGRLVNYWEERDCGDDLFENISDFGLDFGFGFGWGSGMGSVKRHDVRWTRTVLKTRRVVRLGLRRIPIVRVVFASPSR